MDKPKRHMMWWAAGTLVVVATIAWWTFRPMGVPEGSAASNGRIEATEVDIITKTTGRIDAILVSGGQFVRQGEVLAEMDTRVLWEQRLEAVAQIKKVESMAVTMRALLEQWQNEVRAMQSVVKQCGAELQPVSKCHVRFRLLSQRGAVSEQQLDNDRAVAESIRVVLKFAKAQVSMAKAVIEAVRTSIVQAQTRVEAVQVTERRVAVDADDSELKVPWDGCVQYRAAEPDEVLSTDGCVLNMAGPSDVYMTFSLLTEQAGLLKTGEEAWLALDATPNLRILTAISFMVSVAQPMPKTAKTGGERLKLMSHVKVRIPPELSQQYLECVRADLSGMAWVRVDESRAWPDDLVVRLS